MSTKREHGSPVIQAPRSSGAPKTDPSLDTHTNQDRHMRLEQHETSPFPSRLRAAEFQSLTFASLLARVLAQLYMHQGFVGKFLHFSQPASWGQIKGYRHHHVIELKTKNHVAHKRLNKYQLLGCTALLRIQDYCSLFSSSPAMIINSASLQQTPSATCLNNEVARKESSKYQFRSKLN